jgi:hypothetical protein
VAHQYVEAEFGNGRVKVPIKKIFFGGNPFVKRKPKGRKLQLFWQLLQRKTR